MKGVGDALGRLSGVKNVTVRLQEGLIVTATDPVQPVLPATHWREVARVGFKPAGMALRARRQFEPGAFVIDGKRWPLSWRVPEEKGPRTAELKVKDGGQDPPEVEVLRGTQR